MGGLWTFWHFRSFRRQAPSDKLASLLILSKKRDIETDRFHGSVLAGDSEKEPARMLLCLIFGQLAHMNFPRKRVPIVADKQIHMEILYHYCILCYF